MNPFQDQGERAARELPSKDFERFDRHERLMLGVFGMECGGAWSEKNILITMPKNRLISGMFLPPSPRSHHLFGILMPARNHLRA